MKLEFYCIEFCNFTYILSSHAAPMAFMVALRNFLFSFVEEKAEKFKETQRIMGVKDSANYLSWLLFVLLKCAFVKIYRC